MEIRRLIILLALLVSIALIVTTLLNVKKKETVSAATYPERPITMIVPVGAGGGPDLMVRAMEKAAIRHLGQPLVVKNIPGGAATKGWNELAGSAPDGYTLGVTVTGVILQPLYGQTRYHYPSALEPLAQVTTVPIVAVVRADQPWETIQDVVTYAKAHSGIIKFGHVGLGSPRHVTGEMFAKAAGIQIQQVPFDGEPESLAALLGGHIQLIFVDTSVIKEHVKSGKVKVLAMATEQRLNDPVFKDVPTFKEQGLDVVFSLWYGIGAPKGLPKDIKNKLAAGLKEMIEDPEYQQYLESMGMSVVYLGPEESGGKWLAESERLSKIIKETGIAELIAKQKS